MVYVDIGAPGGAPDLVAPMNRRGVAMGAVDARTIRAVADLPVDAAAIDVALVVFRQACAKGGNFHDYCQQTP